MGWSQNSAQSSGRGSHQGPAWSRPTATHVQPGAEMTPLLAKVEDDTVTHPIMQQTAPEDSGQLSPEILYRQLGMAVRRQDGPAAHEIVIRLREKGALEQLQQGARDTEGHTLMHWAAKGGNVDVMNALADGGCPVAERSVDEVGMSPLHWALTEGDLQPVRWLLAHGANIDMRDRQGCTPLILAAQYGFVAAIVLLIKRGADTSALDAKQDSACHWAAYKGHVHALSMLSGLGLGLASRDAFGQTPLHLAAMRGNLECVEYLVLEAKVDTAVADQKGKTALDYAIMKKKPDVELFLRGVKGGVGGLRARLVFLRHPRLLVALCCTGEGALGASWPAVVNFVVLAFVSSTLWQRFLEDEFMELGYSRLLMANILAQALVWVTLGLTCKLDPGYMDTREGSPARLEFTRRMEALVGEGTDPELGATQPAPANAAEKLCYTCCIARPMRSKHCRVCRKCVSMFDHHCPFTGNCAGSGNYRCFYLYLLSMNVACGLYLSLVWVWYRHLGKDWLLGTAAGLTAFFFIFVGMMFFYHTQLVTRNLTTNEHQLWFRYSYLKDKSGRFMNPFDQGCMMNCTQRLLWGNNQDLT